MRPVLRDFDHNRARLSAFDAVIRKGEALSPAIAFNNRSNITARVTNSVWTAHMCQI